MKKFLFNCCLAAFLLSCNNEKEKAPEKTEAAATTPEKSTVDLPYTASYSSSWSQDVSDADLKTVLMSYKNWADGNMSALAGEMSDTVELYMSSGYHKILPNADLMKMWGTNRDSLSSVKIDMGAWNKMYATDKKTAIVVTWYDETDTYKTGKIDSAAYHDINVMKDGKIVYYAQYKRPKK